MPNDPLAVARPVVSAPAALAAVSAAMAKAQALGVKINVAVVDSGGNLAAFLRSPGAFLPSIAIAQNKAYTAAGFGFATGEWPRISESLSPAARQGIAATPRFVGFAGGLPIHHDGQVIGGVGVSGASEDQDEQCARAALAAIGCDGKGR
ncbi:MAG: heme-binding protein [Alphaproteobacteria bacterium]|nr:MAG: heme-binding protein [Alphaproteobacteria bacterium]